MRTLRPDREHRGLPALMGRRIGSGPAVAGLMAVAAAAILSAALAGQRPSAATLAQDTTRARELAPPGDLRCLTRRPEDCLDTPVPADEPHGAVCATCHSLWERGSATGTIRSCTEAECHARADTLSTFHRTVSTATLQDCTSCHTAHSFRVKERAEACSACHEAGGQPAAQADNPPAHRLPRSMAFEHGRHAAIECVACHASRSAHGTVKVAQLRDCRSCHHGSPAGDDCVQCHTQSEMDTLSFSVTRTLEIRIGSLDRPARELVFGHDRHAASACRTCHIGANLEAAASTDCSSCHFAHHEATADCSACHEPPAEGAHDRSSHLGCGGTGCHDPVPPGIEWAPRARQLCLACHTDRLDHKPDRSCADCHVLPPVRGPAVERP